jgi:RNA 2',3'-cyclic 3'-phosphodiesterase
MLEALRADLNLQTLPVRWLAPEGLHLTLAFLGEATSRELAAAWPALAQVAARHHPAPLALSQPEPFPDARQPRLVVAPVQDGRGALQAIQAGLVTALAEAGYDLEDRAFRPHVSLGRLRPPLLRGQPAAIAAALRAQQWPGGGAFTARSVCLMRSDLFPDGARYTVLAEAPLGPAR